MTATEGNLPVVPGPGAWSPSAEDLAGYGVPVTFSRGQAVLHPARARYFDLVSRLHDDGYNAVDLCGVDYMAHPGRDLPEGMAGERFEVVLNLLARRRRTRVRVRVQVPASDPKVDSVFAIHPGVEAFERECWDMFGIAFEGHPDLTRILMPEDWEGHPLRKDYSMGRVPVQFKAAPSTR